MKSEDMLNSSESTPTFPSKTGVCESNDHSPLLKERISAMTIKSYRSEREKAKLSRLRERPPKPAYIITPTHSKSYSRIVDQNLIKKVGKP